jgi:hypothetical protein
MLKRYSTNGKSALITDKVNSFWWVSGTNNVSPIVHVPPNDISATLTALNIQFQEASGPYQKLVREQLEIIQFTLSQPISPPIRKVTKGRLHEPLTVQEGNQVLLK